MPERRRGGQVREVVGERETSFVTGKEGTDRKFLASRIHRECPLARRPKVKSKFVFVLN